MTEINEALEASVQLQCLMDAAAVENRPRDKAPTAAARQAAHRKALMAFDIDHLLDMQDKMRRAIDYMTANVYVTPDDMTSVKLEELMVELLEQKDIEKLIKARYEMIRTMIFEYITAHHEANGVADPTHTPGKVPIPALGKKFTREGGKLKSYLAEAKLAELLGKKRWARVHRGTLVRAVPEHIEYHLDHDALLELVTEDPSVMEIFRACVVPGGYTTMSFHQRDLDEGD